jgi:hypothetical protein
MTRSGATHCPACGQHLPLCPICHTEVLPILNDPTRNIDKHDDKIGHNCQGAGLPYNLTLNPAGIR